MATLKSKLLTTVAVVPLALGGPGAVSLVLAVGVATQSAASCAANPCAAKKASACGACNPLRSQDGFGLQPLQSVCGQEGLDLQSVQPLCGRSLQSVQSVRRQRGSDPDDPNLGPDELVALYDCLQKTSGSSYQGGGHWAVNKWQGFDHFSKYAYPSATHGNRFVLNYTNKIGSAAYAKYGGVNPMPIGTTAAKASFTVNAGGQASIGP